jgi:hypothetical protein
MAPLAIASAVSFETRFPGSTTQAPGEERRGFLRLGSQRGLGQTTLDKAVQPWAPHEHMIGEERC